MKMKINLERFF